MSALSCARVMALLAPARRRLVLAVVRRTALLGGPGGAGDARDARSDGVEGVRMVVSCVVWSSGSEPVAREGGR